MIVGFAELLAGARAGHRAALAFTAYDLTTATAVIEAAERRAAGVVLLVSSQSFAERSGRALVAGLCTLAADAAVPACVQLDHEPDLDRIAAALDAGVGAVMADGSKLPYEANAAFVAAAVRLAERHGAHVEAELGRIEGDEEVALAAARGQLTDPAQAEDFVTRTGAHCLAVSIGNSHGRYAAPPELDWPRLDAVRAAVEVPLSLHGASGLTPADLRGAVRRGIAKVNVNTELREAWFATALARAGALADGARLLRLHQDLGRALGAVADQKLTAVEQTTARPEESPIP